MIGVSGGPGKALFDDKIGDAAICFLGLERPAQVLVQVRGQAFQLLEFIVCFDVDLVLGILVQHIGQSYQ